MSDYNCYERSEADPQNWFSDSVIGWRQWQDLIARISNLSAPPDVDPLMDLRRVHRQRATQLQLDCPRVFISHRQCDKNEAMRIAWLANQKRFDFWLDVLDPTLGAASSLTTLNAFQQAILVAAIIEMALLNCTHVLAVMTKNIRGTMWMPYEFGRVKDSALVSVRAAAWFDKSWSLLTTPEYFHLGKRLEDESDILTWLDRARSRWLGVRKAGLPPCRTTNWTGDEPGPLQED